MGPEPPVSDDSRVVPAGEAQTSFEAIRALRRTTLGDPEVCVAVLDGPVDLGHPCFKRRRAETPADARRRSRRDGPMSAHGTHVTSVIFGQPNGPITGIAPRCRGTDPADLPRGQGGHVPQLDLARAIEQAVEAGAQIINISGGQLAEGGEAELTLARAIKLCDDNNVLVVAAAGNDGCDCLHVPAGLPSSLAVGGMTADGRPLESGNWGETYQSNGVLAPGERIPGAVPGGSVGTMTGSSFATPIVSGVAALLMAIQRQRGETVSARAVRGAILDSALPCYPRDSPECARFLAGRLNVTGAHALITRGGTNTMSDSDPRAIEGHPREVAPQGTPMLVGGVPRRRRLSRASLLARPLQRRASKAQPRALSIPVAGGTGSVDRSGHRAAARGQHASLALRHSAGRAGRSAGSAAAGQPMQAARPLGSPCKQCRRRPARASHASGGPTDAGCTGRRPDCAGHAAGGQPMQAVSASSANPPTSGGSPSAPATSPGVAPQAGAAASPARPPTYMRSGTSASTSARRPGATASG